MKDKDGYEDNGTIKESLLEHLFSALADPEITVRSSALRTSAMRLLVRLPLPNRMWYRLARLAEQQLNLYLAPDPAETPHAVQPHFAFAELLEAAMYIPVSTVRGTLYEFLRDERDAVTRRQVVEALARGRDRVALDFLWPSIQGTGEISPEQAAFWLAHYELHQMSEELLQQASGHPDPNVRFWLSIAALHLGELQPFVELTSQFMNGEVELQVTWGNPFKLAEDVAGCGYFPEAFVSLLRYLQSEGRSTPPEDIPQITKLDKALRTKKNELNRVFLETLIDELTPRPAASKSSTELPTQPAAPWEGSLEELKEELIQESHANRAVLVKLSPAQRTALIAAWFAALEKRTAPDEQTGERPIYTGIGNPIMELPGWFWADFDPDLEQLFGTYLLLYPERTDLMMQLAWVVSRAGKTRLLEEFLPLLPLLETAEKTALLHLLEKAVLFSSEEYGPIFGDGPAVSETVPEIRHFIDYKSAAIGPEEAALTLGDEEEIPRYVQAGVYDNSNKDNPERLERAFLEGKEHLLKVWIGELQKGYIAAPRPVDLGLLPDLPSWDLQVYFWEPNHAPEVQIGKLTVYREQLPDLPVNTCEFTFTPRADLPNFQGRLAVVYQKNVLQMLFLESKVLAEAASADESDSIRFEWAEVKGLRSPEQLQEFDLVFYNEVDPIQGAGLMFFGGQAGLKQVSGLQQGIQEMIVALKNAGAPGAVSLEARKEDLLILANQGSMLYSAILEQLGADSEALLHLRDAQRLQLVSAVRDVFPLEMVYVYPPPGPDAVLCPNAQQAIQSGACFTCDGLSEEEAVKVVCPLGFLGLRCTIERHAIQPLQKSDVLLGDSDYLVRVGLSLGSKTINPLKSSLCATSANVTKGSKRKLTDALKTLFPDTFELAENWTEWKAKVKENGPSTLILVPHTLKDRSIPTLEIGSTKLWKTGINESVVRASKDARPLVLLIGCETAVPDAPYQGFAAAFSQAGAAITVMTLSPIYESHAVSITEILVSQFRLSAQLQQTFSEALLQARRTAMAAGYAEALTLVADGDADWILIEE